MEDRKWKSRSSVKEGEAHFKEEERNGHLVGGEKEDF